MKDPLETKLWGEKNPLKIGEIWKASPAHSPAQRVSTLQHSPVERKTSLTQENHLNKTETPFSRGAVVLTDPTPPTC